MRDHSHEALLIMLFIYFLNFIALPRVQRGRVVSTQRINLCGQIELATCNQSGKDGVFAKEKVVQNCGPFFFAEDVVKPTLSVSLHAWLYFPCEIIFRVGTILSADGIKPVVFSSLSHRQVNMA